MPDGVTTGAVVASATSTVSAAALLVSELSAATIEMARAVVVVLVVEKVIDRNAAWYCAGVPLPVKVSTPPVLLTMLMGETAV